MNSAKFKIAQLLLLALSNSVKGLGGESDGQSRLMQMKRLRSRSSLKPLLRNKEELKLYLHSFVTANTRDGTATAATGSDHRRYQTNSNRQLSIYKGGNKEGQANTRDGTATAATGSDHRRYQTNSNRQLSIYKGGNKEGQGSSSRTNKGKEPVTDAPRRSTRSSNVAVQQAWEEV
ncbi:hypothetical protein MRB53_008746 [Persea americana]|uniref:Uncharacterized protein n=1 Tax=Persea americana TaxID=3435 RepID=A0ACC2LM17_PERAE|nr:hypothetical protein MRB53_008746 [Persea americana]